MPDEQTTTVASDAEIEAALEEAEAHVARIPSLDDGGERAVVPVQAEIGRKSAVRPQPIAATSPVVVVAAPVDQAAPQRQPPPAAPPARRGWLRHVAARLLAILHLRRTSRTAVPAPRPTSGTLPPAEEALPDARRLPLTTDRTIYRLIDGLLAGVNWPFRWVGPEARQLAGLLATVTIVVSLLAAHFFPVLFPPRDAISQLHRRVLRPERQPAPAPATTPHAEDAH